MIDSNVKIGLSKNTDIPSLYSYLVCIEREIKQKGGRYNMNLKSFQTFCAQNDIKCKNSMAKRELDKKGKTNNYFFFDATPNLISKKDSAHHLMRHIRNSIAHALVYKDKKYYILTDKNSNNNPSMTGRIRIDLFESFVLELQRTYG